MKQLRASIDDAIMSVLVKPLARRLARRARRQMAHRARTAIVMPLEDLWQAAISAPVEKATAHGLDIAGLVGIAEPRRDAGMRDGRNVVRGLLIALTAAALVAGLAFIAAAILRSRRQPAVAATSAGRPVAIPVSVSPSERVEATPGRSSEAGLRLIKGIGPETARRLHDIGVHSVEQIATWGPDDVERIAGRLGISSARIEHEEWISQARAATGMVGSNGKAQATTRA
ncbi:MAG: hypothetical protein R6W93_08225 [Candidatus Limnocylindrales bacterium]